MPEVIVIKTPDGREVAATAVEINQANEHWSEFLLEDGSVLKAKLVGFKVFRANTEYDVDGNPLYFLRSTNVVSITSPDSLKRKNI